MTCTALSPVREDSGTNICPHSGKPLPKCQCGLLVNGPICYTHKTWAVFFIKIHCLNSQMLCSKRIHKYVTLLKKARHQAPCLEVEIGVNKSLWFHCPWWTNDQPRMMKHPERWTHIWKPLLSRIQMFVPLFWLRTILYLNIAVWVRCINMQ